MTHRYDATDRTDGRNGVHRAYCTVQETVETIIEHTL